MFSSDSNYKKCAHCNMYNSPEKRNFCNAFFRSSQMKLDFQTHERQAYENTVVLSQCNLHFTPLNVKVHTFDFLEDTNEVSYFPLLFKGHFLGKKTYMRACFRHSFWMDADYAVPVE